MLQNRSMKPFGGLLLLDDLLQGAKTELYNLTSPINLDIKETESGYQVFANLPGLSKENVDITIKSGLLTITVKSDEVKEEVEPRFLLRERRSFNTIRTLNFGNKVSDDVKAKLENGVLSVVLDKVNPSDGVKKVILD